MIVNREFKISIVLWIFAFFQISFVKSDFFEECEGIEDESYVASFYNCQTYIFCLGDDSVSGDCSDGEYFDAEEKFCNNAEDVYCPFDDENEEESEEVEPSPEFEIPEPIPTVANETIIEPEFVSTIVKDTCPIIDSPNEIVLLSNKDSCSDYYVCYHGKAIEMHCSNHLHFNTNTGKCDFPQKVQCVLDRPNANKCLPHVTDFFPHPENCNYFYYCIKGFLTIQQCPFFYGWDIEKHSCVQISQAKCFNNALTNKV